MEQRYELHQGDCLDLMSGLPDSSVDLILCDLPYGTTACAWDCVLPFDRLWQQYRRVAKKNAAIVLTATQPFSCALGASNIQDLRYSWSWIKPHTGQLNAKRMPLKNVEDILVFYREQPCYNPQFANGSPYIVKRNGSDSECYGAQRAHATVSDGRRYPTQVLEFAERGERFHPTQKPVALMDYLIRTYTDEGALVLDNCMGGGTTGIACMKSGRRFIGMEMNADYFEVASSRIKRAAGEPVFCPHTNRILLTPDAQIELSLFPAGGF